MNQKEQKWLVILYSILELDGGNHRSVVLQHINDSGYWNKNDKNDSICRTRNEKVWRNDFSFERQHLVEKGYMKSKVQGKWEITEDGKEYLQCLIDKALNGKSEDYYYTSVFFQKLGRHNPEIELVEGQILIRELSKMDEQTGKAEIQLSDEPKPKGPVSNRAADQHTYLRNPSVAKRALERAGHCCEYESGHTSFLRRDGRTQYMELHHLIPM